MDYKHKDNILTKVLRGEHGGFDQIDLRLINFQEALRFLQAGSLLRKLLNHKCWQFLKKKSGTSQEAE